MQKSIVCGVKKMKKPDEIKKGVLECCITELLTKVEQLETKCHQLERERDAAVKDCASVPCKTCKKNTKDGFCHTCSLIDGCCTGHVWRGVKEDEHGQEI